MADSSDAQRTVTLTRTSEGRYTLTNGRGGSVTTSSGTDELSPVELLMGAIAACTAVDVDTVTTRRTEPDDFQVVVTADKVKDENGNHLENIAVSFQLRFPEGPEGDKAREMLPKLVKRSHDEWCTVSRTIELGTPVTATVD